MTTQRWTDEMLDKLAEATAQQGHFIHDLGEKVDRLTEDAKEQSIRFNAYQQGIQWVVQLAFTLIASATLTVIITAVVKR
ncbi:hypothetical protein BST81_08935 [Leptolyngbya sp. 'hensonii']|uniref:hypothetical protein n=1 Tax=Leptolyngbya sp. 'hensonii' TaxID=1922337 RepID=UPI00094FF1C5|nr:hypothetical protein [Leptolyngbya sp. 'hensonii']OLP18759.1 hypothetical protein BST81_08935 [Leptolyngbya sp. 'hensonii']